MRAVKYTPEERELIGFIYREAPTYYPVCAKCELESDEDIALLDPGEHVEEWEAFLGKLGDKVMGFVVERVKK